MGLLREEFFRLLPAAVGPFESSGDLIRLAESIDLIFTRLR